MEEFGDTINSPVAKSDFPLDKPLKSETADPLPVDRDREGNMANGQKENSSQGEKNPLQKDIWKCSKLSSLGDDMDVNCNVTRSTHGQGAIKLDKDEEDGLMPILFKMALKHDLGDYVFDGSREAVFENVSEYQRVQVEHLSPLTPAAIGSAGESTFHHKGKIKSIFPIPPLPEISIPSNLPSIAAMSNLPPKMQIRIAKIKNPDAIGVLWDIKYVNQNAAPMQSYHLYILYEDCNGNISPWKNIASVKALPLPAACQFTGYRSAKRICFSIIGRDVYGRFGPYSDVQSIIFKRSYQ
ncbi:MCAF1 protein, partial [Polypterus senegalus]